MGSKIRMITSSLTTGTYKVSWYCEHRSNSTNSYSQVRIQINDTNTIGDINQEPKDSFNYLQYSGFYVLNHTGGVLQVDMDYSSSKNNAATYIRRARLKIEQII